MNKALVIGGNGFIGSHLTDALTNNHWSVTVIDLFPRKFSPMPKESCFIQCDFGYSINETEKIICEIKPDIIFCLAWKTLPETSFDNPTKDIGLNITPSLNIIRVCAKLKIKLVFISSGGAIYGSTDEPEISETHITFPISPYGIEKLAIEKYLFMYHYLTELDYLIFRPSNPFGPWQDYFGRQGVVSIYMYRIAKNLPITLMGDGSIVRDYFYISDLVDALLRSAGYNMQDELRIFNVGGGKGVSLNQLINLIEEIVDKKAIVQKSEDREFDPHRIVLNTTRIHNKLGWTPKVSLHDGLIKTWNWMSQLI